MPLSKPPMDDNILYPDLKNYFERSTEEVDSISKERQHILEKISSYLYEKMTKINYFGSKDDISYKAIEWNLKCNRNHERINSYNLVD